jgi:hypothetical protein
MLTWCGPNDELCRVTVSKADVAPASHGISVDGAAHWLQLDLERGAHKTAQHL